MLDPIFTFIKKFFRDLFHAIIFAAGEYDVELQKTKTSTQRFLIWGGIGILIVILFFVGVYFVQQFLTSLNAADYVP